MPAAGVPASVAVPSPLSTKVTPRGQRSGLGQRRGREAGGGDRERARACPTVKVVRVGAGDRRGLVDGEREGLGGVGPTPLVAVMVSV